MQPDPKFANQPRHFWANVRSISQKGGYTAQNPTRIRVFTYEQIAKIMDDLSLTSSHIMVDGVPTELGAKLHDYFEYRANILNDVVRLHLMDLEEARATFEELRKKLNPSCPLPFNKQKGDMKQPAYLTGIVNMILESSLQGLPVNYDPRALATVTLNNMPLRTMARQVDGCFPSEVNPLALWEIKEYYHNKSFGSRIADGVYESLLDGIELQELREQEQIDIKHLLIVDSRKTWWELGRSYLCRLIDMLNMGYVDEILFGREVVSRLPVIVAEWKRLYESKGHAG